MDARPTSGLFRACAVLSVWLLLTLAAGSQVCAQLPPAAPPQNSPVAPRDADRGTPVQFEGKVLYYVHESLGPFTPRERADRAERELLRMAEDPFYSRDLFSVKEEEDKVLVFYGDLMVGVVTPEDAGRLGKSTSDVASETVQSIKEAIAQYRQRRLPEARVRGIISLAVATLLLVVLLFGVRWGYRRLAALVEARKQSGVGFRVREGLLLRAEQSASVLLWGLRFLRIAVTLVLAVIYLESAFSFMPATRGYSIVVLDYLLRPVRELWKGFLLHVGDLFFILVVVVLTRYLLKALKWLMREAATEAITLPGVPPAWATAVYKLVRIAVVAAAAVMVYPYIPGSDSGAFKGISIFAGALFTLGASGATQNFIGGFVLIFTNAFRVGDRVKTGEVTGDVVELTLLVTRLRTIKDEVVTIPNAKVISGEIVNYSALAKTGGLILHTGVTIGYDAPWRTVHALLLKAAERTPGIERKPDPFVLQTALNDFFVTYEINAYTRDANAQVAIYSELHQNIQDAFNEGGVEIMSPHYTSVRDGNTVTIPEAQREAGYTPKRFEVGVEGKDRPGGP
jgi:small-conductance mechanosensitive channel